METCCCSPRMRWPPGCLNGDRKSTRLNSSHDQISYAVFCLKKKNKHTGFKCYRMTNPLNPSHYQVPHSAISPTPETPLFPHSSCHMKHARICTTTMATLLS